MKLQEIAKRVPGVNDARIRRGLLRLESGQPVSLKFGHSSLKEWDKLATVGMIEKRKIGRNRIEIRVKDLLPDAILNPTVLNPETGRPLLPIPKRPAIPVKGSDYLQKWSTLRRVYNKSAG